VPDIGGTVWWVNIFPINFWVRKKL